MVVTQYRVGGKVNHSDEFCRVKIASAVKPEILENFM